MNRRSDTVPIAAIIPTKNRPSSLETTLRTISAQTVRPRSVTVIDASEDSETERVCDAFTGKFEKLTYVRANAEGAAAQRNQGVALVAGASAVLFADDDIRLAPDCLEKLWDALSGDPGLGGVSAMIENQRYVRPGPISAALFRVLHGRKENSYAGLCIGPALNLLPENRDDLPPVVPVQWLNTTCTLYRVEALPDPPFQEHFTGYSLMEDVALSLTVARSWRLANVRPALLVHDSQASSDKLNVGLIAQMELVNRHYVMTRILGRRKLADYARLALLEAFGLAQHLRSFRDFRTFPQALGGKVTGLRKIIHG